MAAGIRGVKVISTELFALTGARFASITLSVIFRDEARPLGGYLPLYQRRLSAGSERQLTGRPTYANVRANSLASKL